MDWGCSDKPTKSKNLENIRNPRTLRRKVIEKGKGNFDGHIGILKTLNGHQRRWF